MPDVPTHIQVQPARQDTLHVIKEAPSLSIRDTASDTETSRAGGHWSRLRAHFVRRFSVQIDDSFIVDERPTIYDPVLDQHRRVGCCGLCNGVEMVGDPPHPVDGCEENCFPGFWFDSQPPPIPGLRWIFNPENRYLNDNSACHKWGNVGFPAADHHRKEIMGIAVAVTVFSMVVMSYGCIGALTSNEHLIGMTYWVGVTYINETQSSASIIKMGLSHVVGYHCYGDYKRQAGLSKGDTHNWEHCDTTYSDTWQTLESSYNQFHRVENNEFFSAINTCFVAASGGNDANLFTWFGSMQAGALIGCVTLIFSLIGCLTRIRWRQDSNFQKLIGCMPDTISMFMNIQAISAFTAACYYSFPTRYKGEATVKFYGPGYICYWFSIIAMGVRGFMHWITPVPGYGAGVCKFTPPKKTIVRTRDLRELVRQQGLAVQENLVTMGKAIHRSSRIIMNPLFASAKDHDNDTLKPPADVILAIHRSQKELEGDDSD